MKKLSIFLLLSLCSGLCVCIPSGFAQNLEQRGLEAALHENGKLKPGINGSFNAQGYEMEYGTNGEPVFKKTASLHKTSIITWSALGSGSDNGVDSFVFAIAVSGTDVYVGGNFVMFGSFGTTQAT